MIVDPDDEGHLAGVGFACHRRGTQEDDIAQEDLVTWPNWRGLAKLPCPHKCGQDVEYTVAVRKHAEDGSPAYRLQEPQVCPNPDCGKPLPELPDAYFVRLEGPLP